MGRHQPRGGKGLGWPQSEGAGPPGVECQRKAWGGGPGWRRAHPTAAPPLGAPCHLLRAGGAAPLAKGSPAGQAKDRPVQLPLGRVRRHEVGPLGPFWASAGSSPLGPKKGAGTAFPTGVLWPLITPTATASEGGVHKAPPHSPPHCRRPGGGGSECPDLPSAQESLWERFRSHEGQRDSHAQRRCSGGPQAPRTPRQDHAWTWTHCKGLLGQQGLQAGSGLSRGEALSPEGGCKHCAHGGLGTKDAEPAPLRRVRERHWHGCRRPQRSGRGASRAPGTEISEASRKQPPEQSGLAVLIPLPVSTQAAPQRSGAFSLDAPAVRRGRECGGSESLSWLADTPPPR